MITSTKNGAERSPAAGFDREHLSARIHIVADESEVFDALRQAAGSIGMVAMFHASPAEFAAALRSDAPSCVLLDVSRSAGGGIELLKEVRAVSPDTPVILASRYAKLPLALDSLRLGAVDFIELPVPPEEVLDRVVRALELAIADRETRQRRTETRARLDRLTPRESEVMALLRQGYTVKEVAYQFGLSHKTVQVHRARLLKRMGVDSVVQLTNLLNDLERTPTGLLTDPTTGTHAIIHAAPRRLIPTRC